MVLEFDGQIDRRTDEQTDGRTARLQKDETITDEQRQPETTTTRDSSTRTRSEDPRAEVTTHEEERHQNFGPKGPRKDEKGQPTVCEKRPRAEGDG